MVKRGLVGCLCWLMLLLSLVGCGSQPGRSATTETPGAAPTLPQTSATATPVPEAIQRVDSMPLTDQGVVTHILQDADRTQGMDQILYVASNGTTATVSLHELGSDGLWHTTYATQGYVGKHGVGDVYEGSGRTPQGTYHFTKAFGVAADPGSRMPYKQVDVADYWVDDPASDYYNQFVSVYEVNKDWQSAEHLIDYPVAYAYALAFDYNAQCVPGKGSAFFLHCETGRPTLGCVAVPKTDMIALMRILGNKACIVIE